MSGSKDRTIAFLMARIDSLEQRVSDLERRRPVEQSRSTQLPRDWAPSPDDIAWARESYPNVNELRERKNFADYYGSRDETRRDWAAAYRNWISKADQFRRRDRPATRSASIDQANNELLDRALDRFASKRKD